MALRRSMRSVGYPHKKVEDKFRHMDELLKSEASTIKGAGDGLHTRGKRRLHEKKFTYIGRNLKINMLYYLAIKTGAEVNTYTRKALKHTSKLKGKTGEH